MAVQQLLAQIACKCHCSRFTWQTTYVNLLEKTVKVSNRVEPEFLKGWLTLQWQCDDAMKAMLGEENLTTPTTTNTSTTPTTITVAQTIDACLEHSSSSPSSSCFSLRLARMDQPQDLEAMGRLVQGLADFEKEPDAVHVTTKHYQNDGGDNHPLFYCLLLDTKPNTNNSQFMATMTFANWCKCCVVPGSCGA